MRNLSRDDGFTLTELLIATTVMLLVCGAALTTFKNALAVNDSASQLADANQNLRAGTNQLIRDLMMAGRMIGPGGIALPTNVNGGGGVSPFFRPGPPGATLSFALTDDPSDTNPADHLADITTGYHLGPTIIGSPTDIVTIMTVDEFMPIVQVPYPVPGTLSAAQGKISADGSNVTLAATSPWLIGDNVNDTQPINLGDLVLFATSSGNAIETVTRKDSTHIYFDTTDSHDPFHFNQRPYDTSNTYAGTVLNLKTPYNTSSAWQNPVTLYRALMITYYVDNVTTPGTPRLTRMVNNFAPQALAGVVEDIDLTYDLVDGVNNPANIPSLPYTDIVAGVTYSANQIRKVNLHMGVRSEVMSKPTQDYVRNHISTAVDVRSLASVDRYAVQ